MEMNRKEDERHEQAINLSIKFECFLEGNHREGGGGSKPLTNTMAREDKRYSVNVQSD